LSRADAASFAITRGVLPASFGLGRNHHINTAPLSQAAWAAFTAGNVCLDGPSRTDAVSFTITRVVRFRPRTGSGGTITSTLHRDVMPLG
jgi:hypothetical protein